MIYIACPHNLYTGGPTLAHQLCKVLNENEIKAKMYYYGVESINDDPVHENYKKYKNEFVINLEDQEDNVIVVTETKTELLNRFPKSKKMIWWMSVDNFFLSKINLCNRILRIVGLYHFDIVKETKRRYEEMKRILSMKEVDHLVQSEYARLFLSTNGVDEKRIYELTDYVEDEIIEYGMVNKFERENIVLYNPRKGLRFTKKIIRHMSHETKVCFFPLINLSKGQIAEKLSKAKLYIDFGNHPGKDRIPREAAICGCCIITGRRGSANNSIDVQIPDKYKFADLDENIKTIIKQINYVMDNYELCYKDFESYRKKIIIEKEEFIKQAIRLFEGYKE